MDLGLGSSGTEKHSCFRVVLKHHGSRRKEVSTHNSFFFLSYGSICPELHRILYPPQVLETRKTESAREKSEREHRA